MIMELASHTRLETSTRYMHLMDGASAQASAALQAFDACYGDTDSSGLGQQPGLSRAQN